MVKYVIGYLAFLALTQSTFAITCYSCSRSVKNSESSQPAHIEFLQTISKNVKSIRPKDTPDDHPCEANIADSHSEDCGGEYDSCLSIFIDNPKVDYYTLRQCSKKSEDSCTKYKQTMLQQFQIPENEVHCEECTDDKCNVIAYNEPLQCYSCSNLALGFNSKSLPLADLPFDNECEQNVNQSHSTICGPYYDACLTVATHPDQNSTFRSCINSTEVTCDNIQPVLTELGLGYSSDGVYCEECSESFCNDKSFTDIPLIREKFQCYTCVENSSMTKAFDDNSIPNFFPLHENASDYQCSANINDSNVAVCDDGYDGCATVVLEYGEVNKLVAVRECVYSHVTCDVIKADIDGQQIPGLSGFRCEVCTESKCNNKAAADIPGGAGNLQVSFVLIALTAGMNYLLRY